MYPKSARMSNFFTLCTVDITFLSEIMIIYNLSKTTSHGDHTGFIWVSRVAGNDREWTICAGNYCEIVQTNKENGENCFTL